MHWLVGRHVLESRALTPESCIGSRDVLPALDSRGAQRGSLPAKTPMEGLVSLVSSALEARGVLPAIRANLRANVFAAINDQQPLQKQTNQTLETHKNKPEGNLALQLVHDLTNATKLEYTQSVLVPEANLTSETPNREKLAEILNLSPQGDEPLLLQLIRDRLSSSQGSSLPPSSGDRQPSTSSNSSSHLAATAHHLSAVDKGQKVGAAAVPALGAKASPSASRFSEEERRLDALEHKLAGLAGLSTSPDFADEIDSQEEEEEEVEVVSTEGEDLYVEDSDELDSSGKGGESWLDESMSPRLLSTTLAGFDHVEKVEK